MMTAEEVQEKLKRLSARYCDYQLIADMYGPEVAVGWVHGQWRAFLFRQGFSQPPEALAGETYDRHSLENFFQKEEVLPVRWAAVRLGMHQDSLLEVLEFLSQSGRMPPWYAASQLVQERLVKEMHRLFPELQWKVFSGHTSRCRAIHEAIEKAGGPKVVPLMCETAQLLGEEEELAHDYDAITGEPVGLRHQLWLNTRKPLNLRADVCSWKLYALHETLLANWLMSADSGNEVPVERIQAALRAPSVPRKS